MGHLDRTKPRSRREEGVTVGRCVTCGTELHPERAEKYDYCTASDCQARNARSLTIAAVGVNKAADQFVILDERTEAEMASGRYQDARRAPSISHARPRPRRKRTNEAVAETAVRHSEQPEESWTRSQQNLALALHVTGRKTLNRDRGTTRPAAGYRREDDRRRQARVASLGRRSPTGPGRLGR